MDSVPVMKEVKRRRMNVAAMHRKTSALAAEAGEVGDKFLEYLYGMALLHLEEKPGMEDTSPRKEKPTPDDQ